MRKVWAGIGLSWAAACCLLLLATPAWAGDCNSPDDCGYIPDNGTKAACAGGVLAGCVLYERSRKKKNEEGEGPSTDDDSLFGGGGGQEAPPSKQADKDEGAGTSADNSSLFGGGGNPGGAGPAPKPPADPGALGE